MDHPKPDGYVGGDSSAAEFVGVTTGTHRGINVNPEFHHPDADERRNARNIADMFSDTHKEDTGW